MTAIHRLVLVGVWAFAGVAAVAADPVPKPAALPAPLPTKDGVRLVLADGSGTTREAALKAAYAAAVGQVAETFVAKERLTGGDDKVLAEAIRTAANGVVAEAKELSAAKEDGVWRVRVVARVAPLKLFDQLRAAKVPVTAAVDGASEFAKAASRIEAGKSAAAWFAFLLRDYPFGCYKADVIAQWEDKKQTTETKIVWNVQVRHTIDHTAYTKAAEVLAESLNHLSLGPPEKYDYSVQLFSSHPGYHDDRIRGKTHNQVIQKMRDRYDDAFLVTVSTASGGQPSVVQDGRDKFPGTKYDVSGRCYVLDKAVRMPFTAAVEREVSTKVKLKDEGGKVVAQKILGWRLWGPMPIVDAAEGGYAPFSSCSVHPFPSNAISSTAFNYLSRRAPHHDTVYTVEMPLADLRRVAKTEVEIVVGK